MEVVVSCGLWLQKRRKALDWTREEFARKVGRSASALRKIETDERRPSKQLAELFANILEIPTEERGIFIRIARRELSIERMKPRLPFQPKPASISPKLIQLRTGSTHPLIECQTELSALHQMLGDPQCRPIVLVGSGGIGETRLALKVACNQNSKGGDEETVSI